MNSRYQSTSPARTLTAIAFAIIFSTTCVLGAVAPAQIQATVIAGAANNATNSLAA